MLKKRRNKELLLKRRRLEGKPNKQKLTTKILTTEMSIIMCEINIFKCRGRRGYRVMQNILSLDKS